MDRVLGEMHRWIFFWSRGDEGQSDDAGHFSWRGTPTHTGFTDPHRNSRPFSTKHPEREAVGRRESDNSDSSHLGTSTKALASSAPLPRKPADCKLSSKETQFYTTTRTLTEAFTKQPHRRHIVGPRCVRPALDRGRLKVHARQDVVSTVAGQRDSHLNSPIVDPMIVIHSFDRGSRSRTQTETLPQQREAGYMYIPGAAAATARKNTNPGLPYQALAAKWLNRRRRRFVALGQFPAYIPTMART